MEEDEKNKEEVTNLEDEILDLTPEEEKEKPKEKEKTVPLEALQEERKKRQELAQRLSELEAKSNKPGTSDIPNPDIELAVSQLDPYLKKRGYLTRQEFEEEKNADLYAKELETLTKKYDGKDGRPAFDPYTVTEFGKKNRIYNYEVAYKELYAKELDDWRAKNRDDDGAPETERPGSSGYRQEGNTPVLTRENLARKLNSPGGKEWWSKNREKVMAAIAKGQLT